MTCNRSYGGCGHHFCWICMGAWEEHGSATGGYYKCNLYEEKKKDAAFAAQEDARNMAANDMARYSWHFERYNNHDRGRKLAMK